MNVETKVLRQGHEISRVIKGGWQLAGDHGKVNRKTAIADMEAFLEAGITTFDCADIYIGVESMIGDFIGELRSERGEEVVDRVRIHTKLVPDLARLADIGSNEIEAIVDRSLMRLKVDCLDLVQFFWWDLELGNAVASLDVLKRMQEKGKIGNLGTTNWDAADMDRFVQAGFDLVSAQVQYSVLDRRPGHTLADWAQANNLQLLCYGTLAGGFLTKAWLGKPDPGFSFSNRSLIKYRLIIQEFGSWQQFQNLLLSLQSIGDKYDVSISSVATRYVLEQPQVAAAIVGARYARHLQDTLEVFTFAFDDEDRLALAVILDQASGPLGDVFALESDRSGQHGRIMKYNLNHRPNTPALAEDISHG
ncbi:MAG: aldo/keto reductase [Cohaesibacteraceae bacterium]|nr:aldo/keto reductase [Cohaesibacteraceae bacterium]